ncbi:MAG TPA: biotin/lipoyl-containing protein [Abditibacteriaceae bacterium]
MALNRVAHPALECGLRQSILAILPCAMSFSSRFPLPTVRAIAQLLDEAQLSEITIETTDAATQQPERLVVRREIAGVATSGSESQTSEMAPTALESRSQESDPSTESNLVLVPSPTVGFFHHSEKPVGVGAVVRAGQTIGIVKTLAIPNDVTAPVDGRVMDILASEGAGVAYGQSLFTIEKALSKES